MSTRSPRPREVAAAAPLAVLPRVDIDRFAQLSDSNHNFTPYDSFQIFNAAIRKELHSHLTSLVDPDTVTRQAFAAQRRKLAEPVRRKTKQQFYDFIVERLGPGQSWALAERLYSAQA